MSFLADLTPSQALVLVLGLAIAFGFEFVNGFHDTANAVATVIYTNSMKPWMAVLWSGAFNFVGVVCSGIGVAYSIVNLLPVELLVRIDTNAGLAMVLALLFSALSWNLGTWYFGIPCSSSHALIGAILGAGLVHHLSAGHGAAAVNWAKASEVGLSLLLSPLLGFVLAAGLLFFAKRLAPSPILHGPPSRDRPPPPLVRTLLVFTCTGVSFAHGSNDGQKGMGLIMLVLIGIVPAHFALDMSADQERVVHVQSAAQEIGQMLGEAFPGEAKDRGPQGRAYGHLKQVIESLLKCSSFRELPPAQRWAVRNHLLELQRELKVLEPLVREGLSPYQRERWQACRKELKAPIEYVPTWVVLGVAIVLGVGTTVGWKRIVVTIGERIGKAHMTYSQGACAELVAMGTIGLADIAGLPVSTTQVLSSGVAGTMWANRSGLRANTGRKILLAWVLTVPATMLLSCLFYLATRVFV